VYLVPTLSGRDAHLAKSPDDFTSSEVKAYLETINRSLWQGRSASKLQTARTQRRPSVTTRMPRNFYR
jgi:hypothetical protein